MAIAHVLTDMDTLQGLALKYYNDASRWVAIADYNKLMSPYLLKDSDAKDQLYAKGYVTVVRTNFASAVTVKSGWTFSTKPSLFIGGIVKTFEVTEDTVIPAGVSAYYLPLRAVQSGTFGNVMEYMITQAGAEIAANGIVFTSVYNEQRFTGGQDLKVLVTGQTIYIPEDSTEASGDSTSSSIDYIYGEDLLLDPDGSLDFSSSGDINSVAGSANVAYAVNARITTEIGALIMHPDYGAELSELIGYASLANRERLVQVAIERALSQETRVNSVTFNNVTVIGTRAYVDLSYKLSDGSEHRLNLTLGGAYNV